MCTECQNQPRPVPAALGNIECRLDSLRSIASCVLETLPVPQEGMDLAFYFNEASNLVAAMTDIIDLCHKDVKRAYEQLKRVD